MSLLARMDDRGAARSMLARAARRKFLPSISPILRLPKPSTLNHSQVLLSIFCQGEQWILSHFDGLVNECERYSLLQHLTESQEHVYPMPPIVWTHLQSGSSPIRGCTPVELVTRVLGSAVLLSANVNGPTYDQSLAPHIKLIPVDDVTEPEDCRFCLCDAGRRG